MRFVRAATMAGFWAFLGASTLAGQQYLPLGGDGPVFQLELTKPFVANEGVYSGASFATSVWDASVTYPLGSGPTLFGRVGMVYASIEGLDGSVALANPRIGAMFGSNQGKHAEIHLDLPLADVLGDPYATGIGIFSDYEELERFELDTWAVGATATAQAETGENSFLGARVGSTVLIPTAGGSDVFALVSVFGDAPTDRTRFRIEFSSLIVATRSEIDFSERSTFFGSLGVTWPSTRFSPTLFVRAPIDDTLDGRVSWVAGLRVQFGG